jgi:hypothetical protein
MSSLLPVVRYTDMMDMWIQNLEKDPCDATALSLLRQAVLAPFSLNPIGIAKVAVQPYLLAREALYCSGYEGDGVHREPIVRCAALLASINVENLPVHADLADTLRQVDAACNPSAPSHFDFPQACTFDDCRKHVSAQTELKSVNEQVLVTAVRTHGIGPRRLRAALRLTIDERGRPAPGAALLLGALTEVCQRAVC